MLVSKTAIAALIGGFGKICLLSVLAQLGVGFGSCADDFSCETKA